MMLKNLQVGNAPQVSLDVLLSAPLHESVSIETQCNVWISAGSS